MPQQSRTVPAGHQGHGDDPASRHLPLVDLLIDTRAELTELVVRSGLKVLETMLEEDRTAVCGPRYVHQADRQAVRAGSVPSDVVLGGRKVALRRPRVRAAKKEIPPCRASKRWRTPTDPLHRRAGGG